MSTTTKLEQYLCELKKCKDLYLAKDLEAAKRSKLYGPPDSPPIWEHILTYIKNEAHRVGYYDNDSVDILSIVCWYKVVFTAPVRITEAQANKVDPSGIDFNRLLPLSFKSAEVPDKWIQSICKNLQNYLNTRIAPWDKDWLEYWIQNITCEHKKANFFDSVISPIQGLFDSVGIYLYIESYDREIGNGQSSTVVNPGYLVGSDDSDDCVFFIMNTQETLDDFVDDERFLPEDLMSESCREAFNLLFAKAFWHLVQLRHDSCVVTDGHTSIFIQLDFEEYSEGDSKSKPESIPIKIKVLYDHDYSPSVVAILAAIIYHRATSNSEAQKAKQEKNVELLKSMLDGKPVVEWAPMNFDSVSVDSSRNSLKVPACGDVVDFDVLEDSCSKPGSVYCIEKDRFTKMFPSIKLKGNLNKSAEELVLKIYDCVHLQGYFHHKGFVYWKSLNKEFTDHISSVLLKEVECYQRISRYNRTASAPTRIRVPTLHDYGNIFIPGNGSYPSLKGSFILLDYVDEEVDSISQVQYNDAVRQLEKMGQLGIKYTQSSSGLTINGTRAMFMSFATSVLSDTEVDNRESIDKLKKYVDEKSEFIVIKSGSTTPI